MKRSPSIAIGLALALQSVLWIAAPASRAVSGLKTPADRVEVLIEPPAAPPFPGEMVLLKVRTTLFGKSVALDNLSQPALENFAWIQLSPDHWFSTEVESVQAVRFERELALFPTRSGALTIDPFIHRLTVTDDNNLRRTIALESTPVELDVKPWAAATGGPDAADSWWLPARSLTIADKWKPDPDRIPADETARRTIVIEAVGLTADRLPPAPKLRSPGVITFAHPVERKTVLSAAGPVARAVYRWDIRPATREAATLRAIPIPWFDTTTRRMRQASLPARRIAFAIPDGNTSPNVSQTQSQFLTRFAWYLSALASFVGGLAIILIGPKDQREHGRARIIENFQAWRDMRSLRRAVRLDDAYRFRAAVCELACRERRSRSWLAAQPVRAALTALDLHLFGASMSERPDLRAIAGAIRDARLMAERDEISPITALDVSASRQGAARTEGTGSEGIKPAAAKLFALIKKRGESLAGLWRCGRSIVSEDQRQMQ